MARKKAPLPEALRRPDPSPASAAAADRILEALVNDVTRVLDQLPGTVRVEHSFRVFHGGRWVYPRFQFTEDGRPRPGLEDLKAVLPKDVDDGNRDAALWLFAPDDAFEGATPAEVFPTASDKVIAVARERLSGDPGCD